MAFLEYDTNIYMCVCVCVCVCACVCVCVATDITMCDVCVTVTCVLQCMICMCYNEVDKFKVAQYVSSNRRYSE